MDKLVWTSEPPTVPGWYWVKDRTKINRAIEFWADESGLVGNGYPMRAFVGNLFAGPIPEPEDQ